MIDWAREERDIRVFVASIVPDNEPSLALVRRLGFVHVGEHWDEEDGLEHEYVLEL
jgi:RimJ/RimL family protein N-acetyltransferase